MVVNYLRKLLRANKTIYGVVARVYHHSRRLKQKICYSIRGVKYFDPIPYDGTGYYSQYGQDRILEILGLIVEDGVFVEIGANDPIVGSNSCYLEKHYGYTGISIDAIDYAADFREHRPGTTFIHCLIDKEREFVDFYKIEKQDGWEDKVSSIYPKILHHGKGFAAEKVTVPAMPLSKLCENLDRIDILMIDVEGHEINVLQSLDWRKNQPSVILAENTGEYFPKKVLENFLIQKGYVLTARIGTEDDIYVLH